MFKSTGLLFLLILFFCDPNYSMEPTKNIGFVKNMGQKHHNILYYTNIPDGNCFITKDGKLVYSVVHIKNDSSQVLSLMEDFDSMNPIQVQAFKKENTNLFLAEKNGSISKTPCYDKLYFQSIYNGIHLELKSRGNNLEKIFHIDPQVNPEIIHIGFKGADKLQISKDGDLIVSNGKNAINFTKPIAYQYINNEKQFVEVCYTVEKNQYSFVLGDYNPNFELIIDPLIASTYFGGSSTDITYEPLMTQDSQGNVFITGATISTDFPTTLGAYCTDFIGYTHRYVAKFNESLDSLLACTIIGGSENENGLGICIDDLDQVFISGYTKSTDFPTTSGSYNEESNGETDIYISKFNNDLSQLIASTYVGGSSFEGSYWPRIDMTIDQDNNVYISGLTLSSDFPILTNSYDSTYNGGTDGGDIFVIKLDENLENLLASTYLGGNHNEWRPSIILDDENNILVCGETMSPNFPSTENSYCNSFNGGISDAFICKFSNGLSSLEVSTFLGGSMAEEALCIKKYESDIYVAGYTKSSNFPTTQGTFNSQYNGAKDGYIARFDENLVELKKSTYIGSIQDDQISDILINQNGVYGTGKTSSQMFPTTSNSFDPYYNFGPEDAFIIHLDMDFSEMLHSTFIGGSGSDIGFSICSNTNEDIIINGLTSSINFPTTDDSYNPDYNGGQNDLFILKIDKNLSDDEVIGIENVSNSENGFYCTPNPIRNQLILHYSFPEKAFVQIKIIDMKGKEMIGHLEYFQNKADKYKMDVSRLSSGIYILEARINGNKRISSKIIKE